MMNEITDVIDEDLLKIATPFAAIFADPLGILGKRSECLLVMTQ